MHDVFCKKLEFNGPLRIYFENLSQVGDFFEGDGLRESLHEIIGSIKLIDFLVV